MRQFRNEYQASIRISSRSEYQLGTKHVPIVSNDNHSIPGAVPIVRSARLPKKATFPSLC